MVLLLFAVDNQRLGFLTGDVRRMRNSLIACYRLAAQTAMPGKEELI